MSYRCGGCGQHCKGRMLRHVVKRQNNSIAGEVPVCAGCLDELEHGAQLAQIRERFRAAQVVQSIQDIVHETGNSHAPAAPLLGENTPETRPAPVPRPRRVPLTRSEKRTWELFDDDRR